MPVKALRFSAPSDGDACELVIAAAAAAAAPDGAEVVGTEVVGTEIAGTAGDALGAAADPATDARDSLPQGASPPPPNDAAAPDADGVDGGGGGTAFAAGPREDGTTMALPPPVEAPVMDGGIVGALALAPAASAVPSIALAAAAAAAAATDDAMQVYLRLRPLSAAERAAAGDQAPVISLESARSVRVLAPESSQSHKNGERTGTFTFSRVFDATVNQGALFDAILAQPVARAVADGKHAHVFAYGG